jgi:RNA polymerase primary sigma factor
MELGGFARRSSESGPIMGASFRIPIHMLNTISKCFFVAKQLTQDLGRDPRSRGAFEYLQIPPDRIREIMSLSQETTSLAHDGRRR